MSPFARSIKLICLLAAIQFAAIAVPPTFTFTTISYSGFPTVAYGINNVGQIVGFYSDGVSHGFLYSNGAYTTIDDPLGIETVATGINDVGQIVGWYIDAGGTGYHGFLYSNGVFTSVDDPTFPGQTQPTGINNAGQIVGAGGDAGFLYSGGVFTALNAPFDSVTATIVGGINNTGQIVGCYYVSNSFPAIFVYENGTWTTINSSPLGTNISVCAYGINDAGEIVGEYDANYYGFQDNGGAFTIVNDPAAGSGQNGALGFANGINNAGQIVGQYNAPNGANGAGYLATPSQSITFGSLSNENFGTPPFAVSATASSGLPVTFSSRTQHVCKASGPIVTLEGVGTCTIQAMQTGNTKYGAAPPVDQSFNVAQGSQNITFGALSNQIYGAPPFMVSATASSGLLVKFNTQAAKVCGVSGTSVTILSVGTCIIQATQAGNADWLPATPVKQSFQVTQASQTITFGPILNQTLGTPPFTVSATASSGLIVKFNSQTPKVCGVSGTTVTLLLTGTCTVQATQRGNLDYAPAPPVSQSFQVTQ